ncbi:FecR domain-containing protein [Niabella sp. CC-SYL272]|uniref:FecR family protein n=1 Tax=Niabella agricola TaxID=2891571 RepID=UPI001F317DDF|nr:FecR domain-containing protein [Niabella agricola]MCF3109620.1 FecR domain-containing protein [Niabella agricola]
MDNERLSYLLDKYEQGLCSVAEQAELDDFYHALDAGDPLELPSHIQTDIKDYISDRYKRLKAIIDDQQQGAKKKDHTVFYKIAAAVFVLAATGFIYYQIQRRFSHVTKLPAVASYDAMAARATSGRYVRLPDSSVVVLRAGSNLKMDGAGFNVATRSVNLVGEAYFDIHHDKDKPFIITAGPLKVTVLGTAFNIKEQGDSVTVTVTRGKVRVERADRTIAVLTKDQQLVYAKSEAVQQQVASAAIAKWMVSGLQFKGESLRDIATKLQERYGVVINLEGKLNDCRITITDTFNGTESIEEVLNFICPIVNASFAKSGTNYTISGQGCE